MDVYTESSGVDTSPENYLNSSVEMPTPERTVQPRKLTFFSSPSPLTNRQSENKLLSPRKQPSLSPPYRGVRALQLFDSPATPKTILEKSNKFKSVKFSDLSLNSNNNNNNNITVSSNDILAKPIEVSTPLFSDRPKAVPIHRSYENMIAAANVNPFTPPGMLMRTKKRMRQECSNDSFHNNSCPSLALNNTKVSNTHTRHSISMLKAADSFESISDGDDIFEVRQAPKRLALQDSNISRYEKEFVEISLLGDGEFGLVFQCINKLDGCFYAIKKSKKPVAGSAFEKAALNEVYAHAVLGKHDNVVRYYSAWAENNHMLIQNEYCNGGSLQSLLQDRFLTESELKTLLLHIAEGLKYIHATELVHMDLKAGNIFITKVPSRSSNADSCDDGFEDIFDESVTYKIGDLGHVTSIHDPQVEEGDCRYLPDEILQEDYTNLQKADIFALGITLYEAAGGGPLPKNGPEWHMLRDGTMPDLPSLSREFNDLIKIMVHPNPDERPSSTTIFNHPILSPVETKSKAQLSLELSIERQRTELLMKRLKETTTLLKSYELSKTPVNKRHKSNLLRESAISDRKLRSYSTKKKRVATAMNRRSYRENSRYVYD